MRMLAGLFAAALVWMGGEAAAQTTTVGTVTMIRTGWNDDLIGVMLAEPLPNPAGCSNGAVGYITHVSLPGYRTYYAALLTAYVARKRVMLVAHDSECYGPWPKLIGVNLIQE
ncbi:MAG: hypothetical protein IT535_10010 [Bauldia sp.]|nr:hypothetical protein [Bauldia sp.]